MILSPILTLDPAKVARDLAFLMDCLSEVLDESGEHALAGRLPWRETVVVRRVRLRPSVCLRPTRSPSIC